MVETAAVDLTDFRLWMSDPHVTLNALRENDPVYWHEAVPGSPFTTHPFWALTRYAEVQYVSRHPQEFCNAEGVTSTPLRVAMGDNDTFAMLGVDGPQHAWMRAILSKAFTAKMVLGSEAHIRELTVGILDAVADRAQNEIDFVHEVSTRLPVRVIGDLLGIPPEDAHLLAEWTDDITDMSDMQIDMAAGIATSARGSAALAEMFDYLEHMQAERRNNPNPPDDIVTRMLTAEIDGKSMTLRQQRECFFVLVTAGNDTTRNTISSGVKALFEHPDQRAELVADPANLLRMAVEEMLRWGSVVTSFRRTATTDVQLGDKQIRAGDWVVMFYPAANRDPAAFPEPNRFDIHRTPNDHLAFGGGGPHFCLGAPLARLELRVMFEELLKRYPNFAVTGPAPYIPSNIFHGFASLPVVLDPR